MPQLQELHAKVKTVENEIHGVRKETLDRDNRIFKQNQEIALVLGSVKNDTHSLKNGQEKNSLILFGVIFITGLLMGSQYKLWLPYASDIVHTIQNAKEITK